MKPINGDPAAVDFAAGFFHVESKSFASTQSGPLETSSDAIITPE
jgi:hypothetical protein